MLRPDAPSGIYKVVKSEGAEDLVFQSVRTDDAMRDNNILTRHIKPAARKLGLPWINWCCLRTSHATWMVEAGANPKDVQGQMRHSRISTTDGYLCAVPPESRRRALAKMSAMVESRTSKPVAASTGSIGIPCLFVGSIIFLKRSALFLGSVSVGKNELLIKYRWVATCTGTWPNRGRPRAVWEPSEVLRLKTDGKTLAEIARTLRVSKSTVYRILQQDGKK